MRCVGCQAEFGEIDGPTHEYMLSSPDCWAAYGEVLAREYSDYRLTRLHRLTVDTYAVQHPGVNVPAARRSVGLHLSRLYLLLEAGWWTERANNAMPAITEFKDRCDWLEPALNDRHLERPGSLASRFGRRARDACKSLG